MAGAGADSGGGITTVSSKLTVTLNPAASVPVRLNDRLPSTIEVMERVLSGTPCTTFARSVLRLMRSQASGTGECPQCTAFSRPISPSDPFHSSAGPSHLGNPNCRNCHQRRALNSRESARIGQNAVDWPLTHTEQTGKCFHRLT